MKTLWNSLKSNRRNRPRQANVEPVSAMESLEERKVLSAVTFSYDSHYAVLEIEGSNDADSVRVLKNGSGVKVEHKTGNSPWETDTFQSVMSVKFLGHGGNDDFFHDTNAFTHILGGAGNDTIVGGNAHDNIEGGPGNDKIYARNGNDKIDAGSGNDEVHGDDTIYGGAGKDVLHGKDGNDRILDFIGNDGNVLFGGAGNDVLSGGGETTLFTGERGRICSLGEMVMTSCWAKTDGMSSAAELVMTCSSAATVETDWKDKTATMCSTAVICRSGQLPMRLTITTRSTAVRGMTCSTEVAEMTTCLAKKVPTNSTVRMGTTIWTGGGTLLETICTAVPATTSSTSTTTTSTPSGSAKTEFWTTSSGTV